MEVRDVNWAKCFCEAWSSQVIYSPTGPILPLTLLDRLMTSVTASRGSNSSASSSVKTMPAALRELQRRGPHTEDEWVRLASFYIHNPLVARSDLRELVLEPVESTSLPTQLPESLVGGESWLRLRSRVCLDDRPGLGEWLQHVHGTDMAVRQPIERTYSHPHAHTCPGLQHLIPCDCLYALMQARSIEMENVLALLQGGGDLGSVGLGHVAARVNHPLSKDKRAVGSFYRRALPAHQPIGFYPGVLLTADSLGRWMEELPKYPPAAAPTVEAVCADTTHAVDIAEEHASDRASVASSGADTAGESGASRGLQSATPPNADALLCQALVWTYDCASSVNASVAGTTMTYQVGSSSSVPRVLVLSCSTSTV
jgi:hypothetical protein